MDRVLMSYTEFKKSLDVFLQVCKVQTRSLRKRSRKVSRHRGTDNNQIQKAAAEAGFYAEIPARFRF